MRKPREIHVITIKDLKLTKVHRLFPAMLIGTSTFGQEFLIVDDLAKQLGTSTEDIRKALVKQIRSDPTVPKFSKAQKDPPVFWEAIFQGTPRLAITYDYLWRYLIIKGHGE